MIQVEHLTKKYGDHFAVEDLTFSADKGTIYGFLGPNGAGKSTTMNIMTGYLAASSGTVSINGADILKQPEEAKKQIGYLPEIPPVYPDMTVYEYLKFTAEIKKIPSAERKDAIERAMQKTEVVEMRNRLIKNLSKGYKQRVGLAQAIINNPDIIIMDEPTAGLDPEQQKEMFDYIRSLKEDHTIILSSHILSDVNAICDYIWILSKGKLIASDTPEGLRNRMTTSQVVTVTATGSEEVLRSVLERMPGIVQLSVSPAAEEGCATAVLTAASEEADIRPDLSRMIVGAGMGILTMNRSEKSLEEIFLTLTGNTGAEEAPAAPAEKAQEPVTEEVKTDEEAAKE